MSAQSAGFAQDVLRLPKSAELAQTLERAFHYAEQQGHAEVLLDHLLLALTEDRDAAAVIQASGVDIEHLRDDVAGFVGRSGNRLPPGAEGQTRPSEELLGVIDAAAAAASQSRRSRIDGAVLLAALIGEGRSPAAELLRAHGLTFEAAVQTLQRRGPQPGPTHRGSTTPAPRRTDAAGRPPAPPEPASHEAAHPASGDGYDEPLPQATTVPPRRSRQEPPPGAARAPQRRAPPPDATRPRARPAAPPADGDQGPAGGRPPRAQRPGRAPPRRARKPRRGTGVEDGILLDNIPRRMTAGRPETVELRIGRAEIEALGIGMRGSSAPVRHEIKVTEAMSVRLRAPEGGFYIETASPETQWIDSELGLYDDDYASWHWTVTPKQRGVRSLQVIVSARTAGPDGLSAETALPEQTIDIRIGINYGRTFRRLGLWLLAMVMGGAVGAAGEALVGRLF